ncbi:OadG family transporter subunit [Faecalimonas sp.]
MKKRISLLLCAFVLAFSFVGCGSEKKTIEYDKKMLEQSAEIIIQSFSEMDDKTFEQYEDGSALQVNMMLLQSGLPIEKEEFVSMIHSWQASIDECGEYKKHGEYKVEAKAKEIILSTEATYEKRKATIEFKFDDKLNMESMDVSAKYSTGEILKKAGLNTVLGMGTVFIVLIFLAFIISLLKYIPAIIVKFGKKEECEKVVETKTTIVEETETSSVDDLELVAVVTAAIAAETGTSSDGFVVRSIKRRTSNNWN